MPNHPVRKQATIGIGLLLAPMGRIRVSMSHDEVPAIRPWRSGPRRLRLVTTALMSLAIAACTSGVQSPGSPVATPAASPDLCAMLASLAFYHDDLGRAYAAAEAGDNVGAARIAQDTLPRIDSLDRAVAGSPATSERLALTKAMLTAGVNLAGLARIFTGLGGATPAATDQVRLASQVIPFIDQAITAADQLAVSGTLGFGGLCPPLVTAGTATP